MDTCKSLLILAGLTALATAGCADSSLGPEQAMDESATFDPTPARPDPVRLNRIEFEWDLLRGLNGYLTLDINGNRFAYDESPDDPAPPNVRFDGNGETLEFTHMWMQMKSGREASSGEATLWCNLWALPAFATGAFQPLQEAQQQGHVIRGTYQFYAPAAAGEELIKTWSISFDNGRINRIELVSNLAQGSTDHIELEIVADQWDFHGREVGPRR